MSGGTQPPPPRRVDERAELGIDGLSAVALIGSGGSSTVYRARQDALDREVAVKVVHAAWTMETRERFEHERELMGRLSGHTDIVPIFETGITKRGEPFLLMPYYERGSLFGLMRERGPLPWPEASFLVEGVATTVADCHREGIVHRDIKPGNVLLTRHLRPRLADFGIALPIDMTTSPATVAYTPSYSPPEALGPGVAAATIDVFSLAATAWALVAGRPPPGVAAPIGAEAGGRVDADDGSVVEVSTVDLAAPDAVVDLLVRSMATDPAGRPADAGAFVAELRRAGRQADAGRGRPSRPPALPGSTAGDGLDRTSADGPPAVATDRRGLALSLIVVLVGVALMVGGALALLG